MLTITEAATQHLATLLERAETPADLALRVIHDGHTLGLRPDNPRPGDTTFAHQSRTVLILDEEMSALLAERTLDVQQTAEGPQLAIR